MKLGNIVYEKELVNHTEVSYINYFKGPQNYDSLDKALPTLYVGWSFMKACNPDDILIKFADILKKRIVSNELYWECSFDENKASHVRGIENFINSVPQFYFVPRYQYINIDPVFSQIVTIDDLMDILPKKNDRCYTLKNSILYLLSDEKIYGLNLDMYRFFKFDLEEIIKRIGERTKNSISDSNGDIYQSYYKIFPKFNLLKRYLITML